MALTKVTYTDGSTVIHATNLNEIQDNIITNTSNIATNTTNIATKANASTVAASASIDSSGLITYKNASGTALFTLQLPVYDGSVE